MPVKPKSAKGQKDITTLPPKFDPYLKEAFKFDVLLKHYKKEREAFTVPIKDYIEKNTDGFTCQAGETFHTEYGSVLYNTTRDADVNKDKLIELVKAGRINLETLISIGSFNVPKLEEILLPAERAALITDNPPKPTLRLTANDEFKAQFQGDCLEPAITSDCLTSSFVVAPIVEAKKAKAPKVEKPEAKPEPKKAKAKKAKSLNDILGE